MILDTHTLLWVDRNDPKLGAMARLQIEAAWRAGLLVVSLISFWEATMLAERDRISLPTSPECWRANWLRAGLWKSESMDGLPYNPANLRIFIATLLTVSLWLPHWKETCL